REGRCGSGHSSDEPDARTSGRHRLERPGRLSLKLRPTLDAHSRMSRHDSQGITAPLGFRAAGLHCGIKKAGLLDLALILSERSGPIAGLFTTNRVMAAPVILDRLHLRRGVGRAILINSGNANACTGRSGM